MGSLLLFIVRCLGLICTNVHFFWTFVRADLAPFFGPVLARDPGFREAEAFHDLDAPIDPLPF